VDIEEDLDDIEGINHTIIFKDMRIEEDKRHIPLTDTRKENLKESNGGGMDSRIIESDLAGDVLKNLEPITHGLILSSVKIHLEFVFRMIHRVILEEKEIEGMGDQLEGQSRFLEIEEKR